VSDVHAKLFRHLVKRGLDRAYEAAEAVSRDHPDIELRVELVLHRDELEQADWPVFERVRVSFGRKDAAGRLDYVTVSLAATRHAMGRIVRTFVESIRS
jgi:hypothetical protein